MATVAKPEGKVYAQLPQSVVVSAMPAGLTAPVARASATPTPVITVMVDTLDAKFVMTIVTAAIISTMTISGTFLVKGSMFWLIKSVMPVP